MSSDSVFPFTWPVETVQKSGVQEAVDYLLGHWAIARDMLNSADTSQSKDVLSLFARLALECPTSTTTSLPSGTWVAVQPGRLRPGDIVRVRDGAFSGPAAQVHNCRVGEVVWVEGGDVVVSSCDGKEPVLTATRYSPHVLDRLQPARDPQSCGGVQ